MGEEKGEEKGTVIVVSATELAHIKMSLRIRYHQLETIMKHIRGEYTDEHKRSIAEIKELYFRIGGSV